MITNKKHGFTVKEIQKRIKGFLPMFEDIRFSQNHEIGQLFDSCRKNFPGNEADKYDAIRKFNINKINYAVQDSVSVRNDQQPFGFDCRRGVAVVNSNYSDSDCAILSLMAKIYVAQFKSFESRYLASELYRILRYEIGKEVEDLKQILDYHVTSHCASDYDYLYEGLYLLKTFDLDIKMGYRVGTVYGLGDDRYIDYIRNKIA